MTSHPKLRDDYETFVKGGGFGNSITLLRPEPDEDGVYEIVGWTPWRPQNGDRLLMAMQSGRTAAYALYGIDYMRDPSDQWFAYAHPLDYVDDILPSGDSPTRMLTSVYTSRLLSGT